MTKQIAFIGSLPADEVRNPIGTVDAALVNIETLLSVIDDIADLGALQAGNVSIEATKAALERIKRLGWIIAEERQRAVDALYTIDDVASAHIEYRIAA